MAGVMRRGCQYPIVSNDKYGKRMGTYMAIGSIYGWSDEEGLSVSDCKQRQIW